MIKEVAAEALETATSDLEVGDGGEVRVAGTDRMITFADVARHARTRRRALSAEDAFTPQEATYPNGTHLAEVEVDPETGATRIVDYRVVDDFGVTLNPCCWQGRCRAAPSKGSARR
jgi:carbon-monoxide dehydrogenase large subunit